MCGIYINLSAEFQKALERKENLFHIHIYFDPGTESEKAARGLSERIQKKLTSLVQENEIKRIGDVGVVGPHTKPNIEIDITALGLSRIMNLLSLSGLGNQFSVLVHTETGNDLKDHNEGAVWFGKPVPFNQSFMNALKAEAERPRRHPRRPHF